MWHGHYVPGWFFVWVVAPFNFMYIYQCYIIGIGKHYDGPSGNEGTAYQ